MNQTNSGFTPEALRLIAAALGLQQCTRTAANIVPLPGTDRFVAIGTAAEVARLLEIAPGTSAGIDLDKLEVLARRAKSSTWTAVKHSWSNVGIYSAGRPVACLSIADDALEETQEALETEMDADAEFLVAACNALPALIALVRRAAQPVVAKESDLTTVPCPCCGESSIVGCDECGGQGKIIVSRADMAALATAEHDHSEGGHHD